jgi:hypothetical protein
MPSKKLNPIKLKYKSISRNAERTVFQGYQPRESIGDYSYYKHLAVEIDIIEISGKLYLTLNPTHFFTSDGYKVLYDYESKLKGIRRMERNRSILNSTYFWAQLLSKKVRKNTRKYYPHLFFGEILTVELDKGFDEKDWGAIS